MSLFFRKKGDLPKLVVDFLLERVTFRNKIMEIVEDFACEFLHFSFFFHHFSPLFFVFFFHFSCFAFSFIFFHFLSFAFICFHVPSCSLMFLHVLFFFWGGDKDVKEQSVNHTRGPFSPNPRGGDHPSPPQTTDSLHLHLEWNANPARTPQTLEQPHKRGLPTISSSRLVQLAVSSAWSRFGCVLLPATG